MAIGTPQEIARKWAQNLGGSTESIRRGVERVTESPTAKAATPEATQKYLQGVQEAVASGRRAAGLNGVSVQDWKNLMLTKGLGRIGSGASAAMPRMERFLAQFLPQVEGWKREIDSMPNGTKEDRRARMNRWFDLVSQFKRS